ncbi:M20/M25/M40 family metallo-hydrolase [Aliikangiella sp. IMCC44359]|uniref:M20/M25/M40 family metallo-hydrolase n=1 Tax=Aliikangiella sp. IMCC44359 TaxID=3459125 RepID=UPI00403AC42D
MKKSIYTLLMVSGAAISLPALATSAALTSASDKKVWVSIGTDAYQLINQKYSSQLNLTRASLRNSSNGDNPIAVVQMPESQINALSEFMHEEFNRCGGFVFHETLNEAQAFATAPAQMTPTMAVNYTIDNAAGVNALISEISTANLTATVNSLKNYHNRYYTQQSGVDAANWIKNKWSSISNGRSDISVETYNHSWNQPSVIATVTGTTNATEIVVIGGHLDSINQSNPSTGRAPGADDNASGIAVITETLRAIVASGFKPKKTIKFMGYAAEEVGLRGSKAIAQNFKSSNQNVIGVAQFDMTGRKGPQSDDIVFISDYTNNAQTQFMGQLIDTYLPGVSHGTDQCGYACSDHASWNNEGFPASFPAEARFNDSNQSIHTANDTSYDVNHSVNFAKLSAAYVGELAKGGTGTTPPPPPPPPPGGNELENGVAVTGLSASTGDELLYTFDVPSGATDIKVEMSGGSGDADMYVKFGSAPTDSSYDCRPYKSGNAESCTGTQTGGKYYVRLKAYSAFSGVTLKGSYVGDTPPPPPPSGDDVLENGRAKTGLASSSELNFTFEVPSGATDIQFDMTGEKNGDADMYVKFGSAPTDSSYDCRPYKSGNNESCTGKDTGGTYYVRLKAYSAFSGVSLVARYTDDGTPPPPPPGNDPINETKTNVSVAQGQWTRYTQILPAGYSSLTVTMSGGTGDADLYVRKGAQSTSSAYDCRPYKNGNSETCSFNNPGADTWHIDLYGYSAASGVTLNIKANP